MHPTIQELLLRDVKNCIKWQRRIKHSHTTVGNKNQNKSFDSRKEKNTWLESSPWKRHVTLVLWRTLMRVRPLLLNVFFSIQDAFIRLVKHMKVLHKWTGWNKSRSAGLQLLLRQQLLNGITTESISLIHRDT